MWDKVGMVVSIIMLVVFFGTVAFTISSTAKETAKDQENAAICEYLKGTYDRDKNICVKTQELIDLPE